MNWAKRFPRLSNNGQICSSGVVNGSCVLTAALFEVLLLLEADMPSPVVCG